MAKKVLEVLKVTKVFKVRGLRGSKIKSPWLLPGVGDTSSVFYPLRHRLVTW